MSKAELHVLHGRLEAGKRNKAQRGELFNHASIGYVRSPEDGLVLDPDAQARAVVALILAQFAALGSAAAVLRYLNWLDGADVVVGRAVLHHIPMAELLLGRLRAAVRPGTRVGFLEPDFRAPLARLAYLEATGRTDAEPLRAWVVAINQLYQARRLSPAVGATLARALEVAGYQSVRAAWEECRSDPAMVENMVMGYDEVRERLTMLGIMTADEIARQQQLLRAGHAESWPLAWAIYRVACMA